jgi:hypothetical protein
VFAYATLATQGVTGFAATPSAEATVTGGQSLAPVKPAMHPPGRGPVPKQEPRREREARYYQQYPTPQGWRRMTRRRVSDERYHGDRQEGKPSVKRGPKKRERSQRPLPPRGLARDGAS